MTHVSALLLLMLQGFPPTSPLSTSTFYRDRFYNAIVISRYTYFQFIIKNLTQLLHKSNAFFAGYQLQNYSCLPK